jgi:hypothetical protein
MHELAPIKITMRHFLPKVCYLMSCLIVVQTNPAFLGTMYAITPFIPSPQCMQNRLIVAPPGVEAMYYYSQQWQPLNPTIVASLGVEANKSGSLSVTCSPTFSGGWDPLRANLHLHAQVGMFSTAAVQDLVWLGCSWPPLRHSCFSDFRATLGRRPHEYTDKI